MTKSQQPISINTARLIAACLVLQILPIAYWMLLHEVRTLPLLLVAAGSVLHMAYGFKLLTSIKNKALNTNESLYIFIPGVASLLVTFSGLFYISGPLLMNIPLIGGLLILYANFILGYLFGPAVIVWVISSVISLLLLIRR